MEEKRLFMVQFEMADSRSDYYIVDLEAGEVLKTEIQSLLDCGEGDIVKVEGIIYSVGGRRLIDEGRTTLVVPAAYGDHHRHLGASCLHLNFDTDAMNKWKDIPPMNDFRVYPSCVSLDGKLYALDCLSAQAHIGEVFDPRLGQWEPLPPPRPLDINLPYLTVSTPVISDEKNHRLVVHVDATHSLYAYYPHPRRSWDCLATDFYPPYYSAIALVDDVLCYHMPENRRQCIAAFDLLRKTWLKVEYSSDFPFWDISLNEWENMFHLGDGIVCLAHFCPFGDLQTNLRFVKIRLQRVSSQDLLFTFVSDQKFPFQGRLTTNRFILL